MKYIKKFDSLIMKKIVCLFSLIIFSDVMVSQEVFSVDVLLDGKLAIMKDDHGNTPFTLNGLVNYSAQLRQQKLGYFFVGQSVEYANLFGGEYLRYSIAQLGYTFNRFSFAKNLEASMAINYGIVDRWSLHFANFGGFCDLSYAFGRSFKFTSLVQVVRRTDIESARMPIIYRTSVFFGIKLNLFDLSGI